MSTPLLEDTYIYNCVVCGSNSGEIFILKCKKIQNHFNYVHSECLINKNYVNCEICGESINLDYVNKNIHYINKKDDCKTFRKVIYFLIILGFSFLLSYLFKMIIYVFIKPIRLYLKNNKYLYYNADIYNDPLNFIVHELIGILFFLFCFYPCCKCLNYRIHNM